ncbi:MAG: gamma carbonic anhydrase family protein [Pseudomonadota bacterium]
MKYHLGDHCVQTGRGCFIAPSADVIGDVVLDDEVSVWFGAVLRGDNARISVGCGSNIQDNSVIHVDDGYPVQIGANVTVGHKVMLHGCTVRDGALIGMNAVVLNGAVIGSGCLIGANALVTEGTVVPDGHLVLGSPAKVIKPLDAAAQARMAAGAAHYVSKIAAYRALSPQSD